MGKKEGADTEIIEFSKTIMNPQRPIPADFFGRKRKIDETQQKHNEEGWRSWAKACNLEGESVLLEQTESGAIERRVHPKLQKGPKSSGPRTCKCI